MKVKTNHEFANQAPVRENPNGVGDSDRGQAARSDKPVDRRAGYPKPFRGFTYGQQGAGSYLHH